MQRPGNLSQGAVGGPLGQPVRCLTHDPLENLCAECQLAFREGQVLDGVREVVHPAIQPLPTGRPAPAAPAGIQAIGGIAERSVVNGFEIACPQVRRQDHGQDALDPCSATLQSRTQPSGGVHFDAGGRGELRLDDHRLPMRRVDQDVGPHTRPRARARRGLVDYAGALGVDSLGVPVGIPPSQHTGQFAVRLRFRVARFIHAVNALAVGASQAPEKLPEDSEGFIARTRFQSNTVNGVVITCS